VPKGVPAKCQVFCKLGPRRNRLKARNSGRMSDEHDIGSFILGMDKKKAVR